MTTITDLHWKRIIAGGIATHLIAIGALIAAIVLNTVLVAFGTGAAPDQGYLSEFNTFVGTQIFPLLIILLTVLTSAWVVRRVDSDTAIIHGIVVGLLVAIIGLWFGVFDLLMVIRFGATIGAGVLGAKLEPVLFSD